MQLMEIEGTAKQSTAILCSKDEIDIVGSLRSGSEVPSHRLAELMKIEDIKTL